MAQVYGRTTRRPLVYTALMFCLFTVYVLQQRRDGISGPLDSTRPESVFKFRNILQSDEESKLPVDDENDAQEGQIDEGKYQNPDQKKKENSGEAEETPLEGEPEDNDETTEPDGKSTEVNHHIDDSEDKDDEQSIKLQDDSTTTTTAPYSTSTDSSSSSSLPNESSDHTSTTSEFGSSVTTSEVENASESEDKFGGVRPHRRMIHVPLPRDGNGDTCLVPAYHEFPDDLFNNTQRTRGAVIVHLLVGLYMFYALAVVCDGYFVTSLERISEKIGLDEDVAGATFMAAGSSAPELFASLLGVFVAKSDVGTGTIVGSAVFNILFVIGICAYFSGQPVPLDWWPLVRDSAFYALTVLVLMAVITDGAVQWWETVIMLFLYVVYIVLMKYNTKLRNFLTEHTVLRGMDSHVQACRSILEQGNSYVQFDNKVSQEYGQQQAYIIPPDEYIRDYPRRLSLYEATYRMMMTRHFRPKTRFWSAAKRIILEIRRTKREGVILQPCIDEETKLKKDFELVSESVTTSDDWKRIPTLNEGILAIVKWVLCTPVQAVLYFTIPNCRKQRWESWFVATFFSSMLWIALFSYILVWMVTIIGFTCGIPDSVMGMTFLAAGTSVPDAISSLIVARQGQGDMAVSNSIGSNVFDILIGLALPWFLQTTIVMPGSSLYIYSQGMWYNVGLLFLSIVFTLAAVNKRMWQLSRRLGVTLLITYGVFLVIAILIEYNILFGNINLPECKE